MRLLPIALLCALAVPASADAAFPGANGPLLFDRSGSLFSAPGTALSKPGYDFDAASSADGTRITFAVNRDIFVMNADGSGRRQLTEDGMYNSGPSFSPDGRTIVFSGGADGGAELYTVPAAGGAAPKRLTVTPDKDEHNPAFSPDGTRIAFDRGCENGNGTCVYVMPAGGGAAVNLTAEHEVPGCPGNPGYHFDGTSREPSWSPDGNRIAFAGPLTCTVSSIGTDIWVMNADGSGKVDLTRDDGTVDRQPAFSPDGTQVAFMRGGQDGRQHIWTIASAPGGTATQVSDSTLLDARPDWAPAPSVCVVPKLKGATKVKARTRLARMGCKLGTVSGKGKVAKQAKRPGKRLPAGTKVALKLG
jgi:Tol biopolymer transport system component